MVNEKIQDSFDDDIEDDEDAQKDKFLTFCIGNEDFGIEIRNVIEIVGIQKITEVPDMPDFVKGVINLRGQVIPVMDVRTRFKMEPRVYDERTCVVVVSVNDSSVGLIVDTVSEVLDIPESSVSPSPKVAFKTSSRFVKGLGKSGDTVKIILDVNKLLFEEELSILDRQLA